MTNDPIIHAKASAIVEAIEKQQPTYRWRDRYLYSISAIRTALASLELQDEMPSSYLEGFRNGMKATKSHPSEREVLEGFRGDYNKNVPHSLKIPNSSIDRYLAKKGGDNVTR